MNVWYYLLVFLLLWVAEIVYIRIARKRNILDIPNVRSSHHDGTVRGGGVVFYVTCLLFFYPEPRSMALVHAGHDADYGHQFYR